MTEAIANRYFRAAVLYAILGMAWGISMAMSGNHTTYPAHAHLLLLGWVSMVLYGAIFRLCPRSAEGTLARSHFWIANVGLIVMIPGVSLIFAGYPDAEPLAATGSIITIASMLLFAHRVWQGTRT
ncbi:MAG: hypothetical protein FJX35_25475 [Alphaproteobacteria bacterium]|nr:hypothetical protein [Alphaproteobacteria bacterium]